jgi:hypothetical protein
VAVLQNIRPQKKEKKVVSKFEQLAGRLHEIKMEARTAGLPFIFSLGDYSRQQEGSTQHVTGALVHGDDVHVVLGHVRDVVLFTPVEIGADDKSGPYFQELKDLLFKWHNHTHTDKLVKKDGLYEWVE